MTAGSTAPYTPDGTPELVVRRLYRSRTNRVLAGICGGIAQYFGSDPTAVRLAAIVLGVFTGIVPMVVAYIVAAIVVPEAADGPVGGPSPSVAPGKTSLVLGALLVIVGVAALANFWLHLDWDQVWPLALIGLGALVIVATVRART